MSRNLINRLIILAFFVLVGYALASSIAYKSVIGIILALISLVAGIVFLTILSREQQRLVETNNEEITERL